MDFIVPDVEIFREEPHPDACIEKGLLSHPMKTPMAYTLVEATAQCAPMDAGAYRDSSEEIDRKVPEIVKHSDVILEEEKPERPVEFEKMQPENLLFDTDSIIVYDSIKKPKLVMCIECHKPRKLFDRVFDDHAGIWKWDRTMGPACETNCCFCMDAICGPYDTHKVEKQRLIAQTTELVHIADEKKREFEDIKSYEEFVTRLLPAGETICDGSTCPFVKATISFCESNGNEVIPPGRVFLTNKRLLIVSATAHRSTQVRHEGLTSGKLDRGYTVEHNNETVYVFQGIPLDQIAGATLQMYQGASARGTVFPIRPDAIKFCPCVPLCAMCPPEWGQWHHHTETKNKKEILLGCFLPPWQERCWLVLSLAPHTTVEAASDFVRLVTQHVPQDLICPKDLAPPSRIGGSWNGRSYRPSRFGLASDGGGGGFIGGIVTKIRAFLPF